MRVISQDGGIDFPYEMSIVFSNPRDTSMVRIQAIGDDEDERLAKYSTEEKAIKAMEMLREAYISQFVEFEDGFYQRGTVFQFPRDEEIEV